LDNEGGYRAEMNMTIKNHKDIEAEVVIIFNHYRGDNLKIEWSNSNEAELEKETSSRYKWKKVLQPD